ncbi:sensor histidine kinase [Legionella bononiensis]|uniref:histidine kinase n=1 Tax=Legionella bononiensis TaxID=2793102 RepID=A0ABS1W9Y4_9GAMM|nr:HAMP domain-containing sensor histidine kinase [Legionella bononiensis]MBL7480642.1 HAMP domain-containing histidine kinase [Legionella bononiensis]MBL7526159.1 HAMP domain-containing histidine kinase [Legionella bononiensis]MBL7563346.1 HAMP domain-containing histidine kinase [Legionella bononiensis]
MWQIKKIVRHLDESMQRSLSNSAHQLVAVGAIAFLGFPFFYLIWVYCFPQAYESMLLRLIGSMLGLGLMLTPYWPAQWKNYLSWYWFLTLLFTLPFFFTFLFLMNEASVISAMSLLCSVFLLVLLVDLLSLTIVLNLGVGMALIGYYWLSPHIYFGEEHIEMALVILFTIIAGSTLNYKTAMLQQQRLAGMAAAAGMIAHELRTPLLGIKSGAQALVQYLPGLIQGYQLAKEHQLILTPLKERRLLQLEGVSDRIVSEIDYANTIIDMLLVKAGRENTIQNCIMETCSMADCLNEAISRYPFLSPRERTLISWEGDFQFKGSKLLMQHVLFNLIKNALYMIATAQRGEIHIWTEYGDKFNYLHFKDTAKGMTSQQVSRLFNHFYTTTFMGTGIGLSFCKLVMNGFGGTISCEAEEGQYALFSLSFPIMD